MEKESKKQMSGGVILSYIVIIVQIITGLIYTPIVLKSLGQSQYGIYSLCTSFMGYLTIMNAGVNAAYIRFYVQTKVKDENEIAELNGLFLKIFFTLSLVALIGGWIIGCFSTKIFGQRINICEYVIVKECFFFLAISSAVQVINCVFSSIIIANEKFIFGKIVNLLTAIMGPIITTPFLLMGYNCTTIIIVQMAMAIVNLVINVVFCMQVLHTKISIKGVNRALLLNIIIFAGFITIQSIMDQLNWQIDKFILARTQGTEEISIYSVGSTFNMFYMTIASTVSGVFIAQINKLQALEKSEVINKLFIQSSRLFAYLVWLVMAGYIIFGYKFIIRWAGEAYSKSYIVGLLLMLPVTVALITGLGQDIARAKNKHQLQIVINLVVCIVNAFVSIPLAIRWGAIGSALGTFIAEVVTCCIIQPIYYNKILNLDMRWCFRENIKQFRGLIGPLVLGIVVTTCNLVKTNYINILFWGIIYSVVYFISMWLFAMNKFEKESIRNIVNRIKNSMSGD